MGSRFLLCNPFEEAINLEYYRRTRPEHFVSLLMRGARFRATQVSQQPAFKAKVCPHCLNRKRSTPMLLSNGLKKGQRKALSRHLPRQKKQEPRAAGKACSARTIPKCPPIAPCLQQIFLQCCHTTRLHMGLAQIVLRHCARTAPDAPRPLPVLNEPVLDVATT